MGFCTDNIYFRNKCHLVYFDLFCFEISYLFTYTCLFVNFVNLLMNITLLIYPCYEFLCHIMMKYP